MIILLLSPEHDRVVIFVITDLYFRGSEGGWPDVTNTVYTVYTSLKYHSKKVYGYDVENVECVLYTIPYA